MFIRNEKFECISKVLCYYFIDENQYFIFVDHKDSSGTVVGGVDDSIIVDQSVDDFVELKNSFGQTLFIDKYILDAGIIDEMTDHQPEAMRKFWALCDKHNIEVFRDYGGVA